MISNIIIHKKGRGEGAISAPLSQERQEGLAQAPPGVNAGVLTGPRMLFYAVLSMPARSVIGSVTSDAHQEPRRAPQTRHPLP